MRTRCPECGFLLDDVGTTTCPKCDFEVYSAPITSLYEADIAHAGEDWPTAMTRIEDAISAALIGRHRGLKVIHGHGSGKGHTARLKNQAVDLLRRTAKSKGYRVVPDRNNPGAHILYF